MASVNKVILVGNLGRDPEVRFMPNGEAVCNFSIATTDSWKDKSGAKQEKTEWHNIVMYRKLAEIAGEYLKKGRPVYVEGRLQTRKWQTKEGQDRYDSEVAKIKQANPDAVFYAGYEIEAPYLRAALVKAGVPATMLASDGAFL